MTNLDAVHTDFRRIGDTAAEVYEFELRRLGSPFLSQAREIHAAAQPMSALFLAQWYLENKYSTYPSEILFADNNLVGARPWPDDPRRGSDKPIIDWSSREVIGTMRLPDHYAGAIRSKTGQYHARFKSVVDAVEEWKYRLTDARYKNGVYVKAKTLLDMLSIYAPKSDGNSPEAYRDVVVTMLRRYDEMDGDWTSPGNGDTGDDDMPTYSTVIPGLPGGPLVTDYPVNIRLIPWGMHNRPGTKLRGAFDTTQHATANSESNAQSENGYVVGGAGGRSASWHITADELGVWISLPFDEAGWHASDGSGPGNYSTVACELTQRTSLVNNPTNWKRARYIAADIMGRTAARKGGDNDTSWHRDYAPDRKWCPAIILNVPAHVAEYDSTYAASYADEKRRMSGGSKPPPVGNIGINDIVQAQVDLNFRQAPSTGAPVLAVLGTGLQALVTGRPIDADGYRWLPVRHTLNTGDIEGYMAMAGQDGTPWLTLHTDNPDPEPEPEYVSAVPIPQLLKTDVRKGENVTAIVTDDTGNEFTYVRDVVTILKDTVPGQYAIEGAKPIGPTIKAGENVLAAWIVRSKADGSHYYILTGPPGIEWARISVANTRWFADAPLQGDEWGEGHGEDEVVATFS